MSFDWRAPLCVLASLLFFLMALPLAGQLPTATILGTVRDPNGAVVGNAIVTVLNTDTNLSRTVNTGDDGSYLLPALPVGNYTVRVMREGFQAAERKGLTLEVAQKAVVDVVLALGSTRQTVEVVADAPLVNTTNSAVGK